MTKHDHRVQYTKHILKETLIKILKKQPINKITIKNLCEKANLNRSTFYSHYNDQYDLLKQIENEFFNDIKFYLKKYQLENNQAEFVAILTHIFTYIKDNKELSKILLTHNDFIALQKKIMLLIQEQTISEWRLQIQDKNHANYIYIFTITGSIGVLQQWLKNDLEEPPEEIAHIITNYIYASKKNYNTL